MKCPNCKTREGISTFKAEGFTSKGSPIKECGICGHVWRIIPDDNICKIDIIRQGKTNPKK